MQKTIRLLNKILFFSIIYKVIAPSQVLAYIDPGSGSYFAQFILGILLGTSFFWKSILRRIKSFFLKKEDNVKPPKNKNGKTKAE